MNLLTHPIFLAIIASLVTYIILKYVFDSMQNKNNKNDKKKTPTNMKDLIVIMSAVIGLTVWYVVSTRQNEQGEIITDSNNATQIVSTMITPTKIQTVTVNGDKIGNQITNDDINKLLKPEMQMNNIDAMNTQNAQNIIGGNKLELNTLHKSQIYDLFDNENNSYLLGTGINIPNENIVLPSVLIDYN